MSIITRGFKMPLNKLDNPIYADIKQAPPRFVDAGKHWTVDTGSTLLETEHIPQAYEDSILVQSRDYNKTVYGQSSHKDVVNQAFRPPLLTQEDILPLNRLPRNLTVPRINPSTLESYVPQQREMGNVTEFTSTDMMSYTTERVKKGRSRPTFYMPMDQPVEKSAYKAPNFLREIPSVPITSGNATCSFSKTGRTPHENIKLEKKREYFQYDNKTIPLLMGGRSDKENITLDKKREFYSAVADISSSFAADNSQRKIPEMKRKIASSIERINPGGNFSFDQPKEIDNARTIMEDKKKSIPLMTVPEFGFRNDNSKHVIPFKTKAAYETTKTDAYQAKGFIPKFGIEQRRVKLKTK